MGRPLPQPPGGITTRTSTPQRYQNDSPFVATKPSASPRPTDQLHHKRYVCLFITYLPGCMTNVSPMAHSFSIRVFRKERIDICCSFKIVATLYSDNRLLQS